MKTIAPALAGHLESDATTTCHCWKVTLKDGAEIGFTDHDEALFFAGTAFLAASGFSASDNDSETGLGAGAGEVAGGFSSEAISEEDLAAGRFDGARVELYLVNWQAPEEHVLLSLREIGDVARAGGSFRAELRSFAHRLNQPQGRVYGRRCDAALGDARCGVALARFTGNGRVVAVDAAGNLVATGLDAFPDGSTGERCVFSPVRLQGAGSISMAMSSAMAACFFLSGFHRMRRRCRETAFPSRPVATRASPHAGIHSPIS